MLLQKANNFDDLGYMIDCSRGAVPTVDTLKKFINILSSFGYNYLMLYTEDTYEIDGEPYFGYMRGRYSKEEIKEIDEYCKSKNMELRACIQTLAHLRRLKRHSQYSNLFEIENILTVKDENTYIFIDKMLKAVSEMFSCKKVHIGMDEAWALGRGKFLDQNGIVPKTQIMSYHLNRVSELAKKYGFECDIWADMLYNAYMECPDKDNYQLDIPDNITPISWRYWVKTEKASEEEFELYNKITNNKYGFAGGAQKWDGFVPNNTYSFLALQEQIKSCKKFNVKRFLLTAWGDGGADASLFSTLPAIFYTSLLAHDIPLDKNSKKYFKDVVGISFENYLSIDKLNRLTLADDDKSFNNLSFIYLYNDVLQGMYNEVVLDNANELISKAAKKINRNVNNPDFGYIFKTLHSLANVIKVKANIGNSLYNHYKANDKNGLKKDVTKLKRILKNLDAFMADFEYQWHKENKSFGFEKQNIRLGGLKERLSYAIRQLNKYINNSIDKIDELEANHLPVSNNWWDHNNKENNSYNCFADLMSGGSLHEF